MRLDQRVRVLVCGGRDYQNRRQVFAVMDALPYTREQMIVITCGFDGVDTLADDWAAAHDVWSIRCPGNSTPEEVIDAWAPDIVVAFRGGDGTITLSKYAEERGSHVVRIE